MKSKTNREIKRIFFLLAFSTLLAAMSGCSSKPSNNAAVTPVNRDTPQTTQPQTPTPDPMQALYGEWETDDPTAKSMSGGTTPFVRWKINPGIKDQNGLYIGKITDPDGNNRDLANYKIGPQKNINLEFLPPAPAASFSYDYEVSGDGNTLTLTTGNKPMIFKRGTTNRDVLKDAETIYNGGNPWEPTSNTAKILMDKYNVPVTQLEFEKPIPSGEGYGGDLRLVEIMGSGVVGNSKDGKYIIASKGNVILDIGAGRTPAKYTLEQNGDLLKITFTDGTDWVFNRK